MWCCCLNAYKRLPLNLTFPAALSHLQLAPNTRTHIYHSYPPLQALRENPGHSLLLVPQEFLEAMLEEVGVEGESKPKKGKSAKPVAAKKSAAKPAKKAVKTVKKPAAKKVLKK